MNFYAFIPRLLNMSLTASVAIVFVLLLRLMLKKVPKVISYALWAVVLFRLLCPISIESSFSLFGLMDAPTKGSTTLTTNIEYVPEDIVHTEHPAVALPIPGISNVINSTLPSGREQLVADPLEAPVTFATYVWLAGVLVMAAYSVISYRRLRQKLLTASPLRDNIYLADEITSPFVMGLIRPKIYLPSEMDEREQAYIIRHEQHHIRRGDHIIKALAFLALSIHWFNPLVWVAFIYSSKDMEMSCDEAVVKKMGDGILADYTASLLSLATGKQIIAGMPLAFGEGDTKSRIRNLANWRKPAFWVVLISVVACVVLAVGLMTNPARNDSSDPAEDSFFLQIGADGVHSVEISGINTSGGVVNADGAAFEKGEKVWLESLQGVTDLRGYSITALGKNGEVIYNLSIPEGATNDEVINLVGSDGWLLAPADYDRSLSGRATNTYVYEYDGIIGRFYITLSEDGSFTYHESGYSSYLGHGTWKLSGDLITLTENVRVEDIPINRINHFKLNGDDLIYVAKDSFNFPHVKLEDGDRFHCKDSEFNVEAPQRANVKQSDTSGAIKATGIPVAWTYSPMMSATWHAAFYFEFAFDYTHIKTTCDQGELWNLHGEEQSHNTEMQFESTNPICWTPSMNNSLAQKANVDFTVYDEEMQLYTGRIEITKTGEDGGRTSYEARLINAPTLYMLPTDSGTGAKIITVQAYEAMTSQDTVIWSDADLDHDGTNETIHVREMYDGMAYELSVVKQDGTILWSTEAHTAHAGYNSLFVCTLDGVDYLLQYHPTMYQGDCNYTYRLFALDTQGRILINREASVNFDTNWGSSLHREFNAVEVANFMDDVNDLLAHSKLLLSTDSALDDIDPENPQDIPWWLLDKTFCSGYVYDESKTLRDNLLELEKFVES